MALALLQARVSSRRLPGKVLRPLLGRYPLGDGRPVSPARIRAAVQRLAALLPADQEIPVLDLWEEFEAGETPEARFAKAMDRLQPMLLNYHSGGEAWTENGIREHQVREVNAPIEAGSATLWARARQLISEAVAEGFLQR